MITLLDVKDSDRLYLDEDGLMPSERALVKPKKLKGKRGSSEPLTEPVTRVSMGDASATDSRASVLKQA